MRHPGASNYLAGSVVPLVIIFLAAVSGWATTPSSLHTFPLTIGAEKFELQEVDVGANYGCPPGTTVGVILKDGKGIPRWSFNVRDTASFLAVDGCTGDTSAASIVGVAVPRNDTGLWVI